jgi:hypothetical protein
MITYSWNCKTVDAFVEQVASVESSIQGQIDNLITPKSVTLSIEG